MAKDDTFVCGPADSDRDRVQELARLLPQLQNRLRRAFPRTSDDVRHDAAVDALVGYWIRPDQYDQQRGVPLEAYLYQAARRNVIDVHRSEARRRARECAYAQIVRTLASPRWLVAASAFQERLTLCGASIASTTERSALCLWASGEGVLVIAAALGIDALPASHQRAEVKRFKDRMIKRLRRAHHKSS